MGAYPIPKSTRSTDNYIGIDPTSETNIDITLYATPISHALFNRRAEISKNTRGPDKTMAYL